MHPSVHRSRLTQTFSRLSRLVAGCAVLLPALCGFAAETAEQPLELDLVVVVASKSPRPIAAVAAQVSVITAAEAARGMVEDLDGLLRYEPGLDMTVDGTRFGASGINIRGIAGNRVAIEQDGIPLRDGFSVGAFSNGGRSLLETDRIKRVEVLYGPASALYGSRALGGVVAITTWNPSDLLSRTQGSVWSSVRAGYQGSDNSWVGSAMLASGHQAHGLLLAASWRQGHQLEHQAPAGTADDPQDRDSRDAQLRYTFDTAAGHRLRLTVQGMERDTETQMVSPLGFGRRFRTTTALAGSDHDESQSYALDYAFSLGGWQQGEIQLYRTEYSIDQLTLETRAKASPAVGLARRFSYQQQHTGADLTLFREERLGGTAHRIGVGLEWVQADATEQRDGVETNLATGESRNSILGEIFPLRDFPLSRGTQIGVFVQDEISLGSGRWEVIPALRWDRHELDPRPDATWLQSFADTPLVSISESELTPRLGLVYHLTPRWTSYAQYARGFRAPPFEDVNIGLNIPLFGYRALANPDLESETSNGLEWGLRYFSSETQFSLALFHTDFDEFIETRALLGVDPVSGDLLFQSRNIDRARIQGVDLRYQQQLGRFNPRLQHWTVHLAALWTRGDNRESGEALNSVAPPQAILGLQWQSDGQRWDVAINATFTAAKRRADIDLSDGPRFATPSWTTWDISAGWQALPNVSLRAGVFNLADATYWRWLDVSRLDASDPMIPLLSRPGRNVSLSANIQFR